MPYSLYASAISKPYKLISRGFLYIAVNFISFSS
jgi:hypothetical protein